ncbi:MAG: hypothetical protein G8345_12285, partial [Magnetococcales bacterium]|nr:hypothetical protein [Magnetococcales bacterium]
QYILQNLAVVAETASHLSPNRRQEMQELLSLLKNDDPMAIYTFQSHGKNWQTPQNALLLNRLEQAMLNYEFEEALTMCGELLAETPDS